MDNVRGLMKFPGFDGKLATHSEFQRASFGTELTYSIKIIYNSNKRTIQTKCSVSLRAENWTTLRKTLRQIGVKNKLQPQTEMIFELNPFTPE